MANRSKWAASNLARAIVPLSLVLAVAFAGVAGPWHAASHATSHHEHHAADTLGHDAAECDHASTAETTLTVHRPDPHAHTDAGACWVCVASHGATAYALLTDAPSIRSVELTVALSAVSLSAPLGSIQSQFPARAPPIHA